MIDYYKAVEVFENSKQKFYNVDEKNPSFVFLLGTKKEVMFSCPHAVAQIRNGKVKLADIFTGPLGMALSDLGYSVIIKTNTLNDDANYDLKCEYKKELSNYIKKHHIKFLIDLHGMSAKREVLFSLGTNYGKHIDKNTEPMRIFTQCALKNKIDTNLIRSDFPFASSLRTVSRYIYDKNKIETLQIEINSKLFNDKDSTFNVIKTLDEYAEKIIQIKQFKLLKFDKKSFALYDQNLILHKFDKTFTYKQGRGDVLICAPHSASMFKEGRNSYQESYSGAIALQLHDKLNMHTLVKTKSTDYDSTQEYLQNVSQIISDKKIKFVIELHIMNQKRPEDIVVLCNNAKSIDNNIALLSNILKVLISNKFENCSIDYPFNADNLNSTVNLIKQNYGVCALQFIINKKIVDNSNKYKRLMKVLQKIINLIKIY